MHSKAIIQSHWASFLCLAPFLIMLAVHRLLGLSDALMVQTPPSEREAHTYNLIMTGVFFIGIAAFIIHAFAFARGDKGWLVAKLVALVVYWSMVVILGSSW
jgi:hypothetical protein